VSSFLTHSVVCWNFLEVRSWDKIEEGSVTEVTEVVTEVVKKSVLEPVVIYYFRLSKKLICRLQLISLLQKTVRSTLSSASLFHLEVRVLDAGR